MGSEIVVFQLQVHRLAFLLQMHGFEATLDPNATRSRADLTGARGKAAGGGGGGGRLFADNIRSTCHQQEALLANIPHQIFATPTI